MPEPRLTYDSESGMGVEGVEGSQRHSRMTSCASTSENEGDENSRKMLRENPESFKKNSEEEICCPR